MTKADFQSIAAIIRDIADDDQRRLTALRFRDGLRVRFHKFDGKKFLWACGFSEEEAAFLSDATFVPQAREPAPRQPVQLNTVSPIEMLEAWREKFNTPRR